jgi:hypothetical protein
LKYSDNTLVSENTEVLNIISYLDAIHTVDLELVFSKTVDFFKY